LKKMLVGIALTGMLFSLAGCGGGGGSSSSPLTKPPSTPTPTPVQDPLHRLVTASPAAYIAVGSDADGLTYFAYYGGLQVTDPAAINILFQQAASQAATSPAAVDIMDPGTTDPTKSPDGVKFLQLTQTQVATAIVATPGYFPSANTYTKVCVFVAGSFASAQPQAEFYVEEYLDSQGVDTIQVVPLLGAGPLDPIAASTANPVSMAINKSAGGASLGSSYNPQLADSVQRVFNLLQPE
jgi:predicted small lipoprotein YifL